MSVCVCGIHEGITNTLESFPHSYMQKWAFQCSPGKNHNHNLAFVASLLKISICMHKRKQLHTAAHALYWKENLDR